MPTRSPRIAVRATLTLLSLGFLLCASLGVCDEPITPEEAWRIVSEAYANKTPPLESFRATVVVESRHMTDLTNYPEDARAQMEELVGEELGPEVLIRDALEVRTSGMPSKGILRTDADTVFRYWGGKQIEPSPKRLQAQHYRSLKTADGYYYYDTRPYHSYSRTDNAPTMFGIPGLQIRSHSEGVGIWNGSTLDPMRAYSIQSESVEEFSKYFDMLSKLDGFVHACTITSEGDLQINLRGNVNGAVSEMKFHFSKEAGYLLSSAERFASTDGTYVGGYSKEVFRWREIKVGEKIYLAPEYIKNSQFKGKVDAPELVWENELRFITFEANPDLSDGTLTLKGLDMEPNTVVQDDRPDKKDQRYLLSESDLLTKN